jgi:hypothetical protein
MLIGVLSEGETATASQLQDGLASLNDMMSSWSTENLIIFQSVREEFSLVPGTGSYTMGVGGVFNTSRPLEIEIATIEDQSSTPTLEIPLEIINLEQRAMIAQKDTQSTFPTQLYVEYENPLAVLYPWPVPSAAHKLVLYSRKPLTAFASANTVISLPPGYERALRFNLAPEIAPEYGRVVSNDVLTIASESKANIKRINKKPRYLQCDGAVLNTNKRHSILTGV